MLDIYLLRLVYQMENPPHPRTLHDLMDEIQSSHNEETLQYLYDQDYVEVGGPNGLRVTPAGRAALEESP